MKIIIDRISRHERDGRCFIIARCKYGSVFRLAEIELDKEKYNQIKEGDKL